jgi:hypothetical protein
MVGNSEQRQTRINPMTRLSRRETLLAPVALAATSAVTTAAAEKKMTFAMHQNTSNGAGYRKSLEGWARAEIRDVEITNILLDEFLKTDSLASARQVITDLGLNAVQGATGVLELFEPNPNRSAALDNLKRRCEMYASMGLSRVYATTATSKKITEEDYKAAPENIHDAGEVAKQFNMSLRIEFPRFRKKDMPARSPWNSSCQNSNKVTPTRLHVKFVLNPKQLCAGRVSHRRGPPVRPMGSCA